MRQKSRRKIPTIGLSSPGRFRSEMPLGSLEFSDPSSARAVPILRRITFKVSNLLRGPKANLWTTGGVAALNRSIS